jgi:uncharacterized protein
MRILTTIHRSHPYPIERHRFLRRSFVFVNGIGPRTEKHLWSIGIVDWERLFQEAPSIFAGKRLDGILRSLVAAFEAWERGDLHYFHQVLPGDERWRLIPGGFEDIAYFDIEATGNGMPPDAHSTAVAFCFRGELLQEWDYRRKLELIDHVLTEASMICTYNGAAYDIPFLTNEFNRNFAIAHIDLCPWFRRLGFTGGLKSIQRQMPHLHQRVSMDINGYDAVRLWRMHEAGVERALEALLTYNAEDVLILEGLLVEAFNRELELRPHVREERLKAGPVVGLKTGVSAEIYQMLRQPQSGGRFF